MVDLKDVVSDKELDYIYNEIHKFDSRFPLSEIELENINNVELSTKCHVLLNEPELRLDLDKKLHAIKNQIVKQFIKEGESHENIDFNQMKIQMRKAGKNTIKDKITELITNQAKFPSTQLSEQAENHPAKNSQIENGI